MFSGIGPKAPDLYQKLMRPVKFELVHAASQYALRTSFAPGHGRMLYNIAPECVQKMCARMHAEECVNIRNPCDVRIREVDVRLMLRLELQCTTIVEMKPDRPCTCACQRKNIS